MLRRYPVLLLCVVCTLGVAAGLVALLRGHWLLAGLIYAATVAVLAGILHWLGKTAARPPQH